MPTDPWSRSYCCKTFQNFSLNFYTSGYVTNLANWHWLDDYS